LTSADIPKVRPEVTGIPDTMFTLKTPLTEEDPFFFIGFVKGYRSLDYLYYIHGGKPAFLDLPIATGDWSDVWVHVATLKGGTRKEKQLPGKVTWGDIMEFLHALHPTGTLRRPRGGGRVLRCRFQPVLQLFVIAEVNDYGKLK
jgi:hypothetical protein